MLYRHVTDRADLQRAVGEEAVALLLARIAPELDRDLWAATGSPVGTPPFALDAVD